MKQLLFVFFGGGLGSIARYFLAKFYNSPVTGIPYGTLMANVLGSLFIGLILGWVARTNTLSENHTLLLATGFCGGFTTFSTFAYENHLLLKSGDFFTFFLYTLVTFILGFLAVFLGMYLVR
ncbi:MAG: fluoride efflux transporter CrcB [Flavobacteriales bacterium]|nr:MAG: fluoride efflux transporter CrcB [Flavobacteriales bacterium]PIE49843.1 MAG: fluoride efflux transporter CrcB [Flavobacteriales bacterium]